MAFAPLIAVLEDFPVLSVYAAGGVAGFGTAAIVTVPILTHSERARRVGAAVAFWLGAAAAGVRYHLSPRAWWRAIEFGGSFANRLRDRRG